jgi:hypothetical protein
MAIRFHPLPPDVFPEAARPSIARLNMELRDLFGLEGTISDPRQVSRSDGSIVRRESESVALTRITPSIVSAVSGTSTAFATPTIGYGTAYAAGTGTNALRNNATLLFPTSLLHSGTTYTATMQAARVIGLPGFPAPGTLGYGSIEIKYPDGPSTVLGTVAIVKDNGDGLIQGPRLRTRGALWVLPEDGETDALYCRPAHNTRSALEIEGALEGPGTGRIMGIVTWGVAVPGGYQPGGKLTITASGTVELHREDSVMLDLRPLSDVGQTTIGVFRLVDAAGDLLWQLRKDGLVNWGDGAGLTDINLYRGGADILKTDDSLSTPFLVGPSVHTSVLQPVSQTSAVNYFSMTNALAAGAPTLATVGTDASIDLVLDPKGNAFVVLSGPVSMSGTAAAATATCQITQPNTGGVAGEHITFNDKAGDPPSPTTGGLWRNAGTLKYRRAAATIDLTTQLMSTANNAPLTLTDDATNLTLTAVEPGVGYFAIKNSQREQRYISPLARYRWYQADGTTIGFEVDVGVTGGGVFSGSPPEHTGTGANIAAFLMNSSFSPTSGAIGLRQGHRNLFRYGATTTDAAAKEIFSGHFGINSTAGNTLGNNSGDVAGILNLKFGGTWTVGAARTLANAYGIRFEVGAITVTGALTNAFGVYWPGWGAGTNRWAFYAAADDSALLGKLSVGTATVSTGQCSVDQASTTAAIPSLYLNQADVSEEMMEFNTTIGTGNAIEAVAAKVLTTTHFVKVTIPGGLTRYFPVGTIA